MTTRKFVVFLLLCLPLTACGSLTFHADSETAGRTTPTETPVQPADEGSSTPEPAGQSRRDIRPGPLSTGDMNVFLGMREGEAFMRLEGDVDGLTDAVVFRSESPDGNDQLIAQVPVSGSTLPGVSLMLVEIHFPGGDLPDGTYFFTEGTPFSVRVSALNPGSPVVYDTVTGGQFALYFHGFSILSLFEIEMQGTWQVDGETVVSTITLHGATNNLRRS